jgi:ubiquinone/menaquinone biosynthesis C-methylase UbiE
MKIVKKMTDFVSSEYEQQIDDLMKKRTLEEAFPELKPYLKPGLKVLDIGCGPGSITLDVAQAVKPGEVVGIDLRQNTIDRASQLAKELFIDHVVFQVGDTLNLEFPDDTFDIVYSHTVLHSVIDPIRGLRQQKRVTKPGGWVIAAGVREFGVSPHYPKYPAVEKALAAFVRYFQDMHTRFQSGQQAQASPVYFDLYSGRKISEWYAKAGLTIVNVQVNVDRVSYPGAEGMEPRPGRAIMTCIPPMDDPDDMFSKIYVDILAKGYLDETTLIQAQQEISEWYLHLHAFYFNWYVFAAGRA